MIKASDFGPNFTWGVATAAPQIEGAASQYGKGPSIWDTFASRSGKIKNNHQPDRACDFYHRYREDLALVKLLGFKVFRFSIAWSRILPNGIGATNQQGISFYHQVIDECLALQITPYITLYHWDLPQALENDGGWTSFSINAAFNAFVKLCALEYGDKVKNWLILNEPFGFTSLGYMLGVHAPGKTGLSNFFPAVLHTALAQADGGHILRSEVKNANIGTTYSCSEILPYTQSDNDLLAAKRVDCLMNRLFVEPAQGLGFPTADWEMLEKFQMEYGTWRFNNRMKFDFDFIGLQSYFPLTVKYNPFIPVIQAWEVKAKSRKKPHTAMGWEVNADSFYNIIKQFSSYPQVKNIVITENGAAYRDHLATGNVVDAERIKYFELYLAALLKVKNEGINVTGYMVWTLMDNFEWAEGYNARFGLIHTDFATLKRTIKYSGYWWQEFLRA
ncbi:GH1 family beta-glucosidase [Pedobacter sandarakinus]|uniref:GH1 family beta-glucosidase n=1 Tax=Pedobacter sandarakinus TaxID=353156 RepID=UPI0022469E95|nr:GH1 family beta-glucosidase [Pedobacter sandarakinus]MCX2573098.1 GH1 family beta-glucosidase [Pedobacter sandarakinus]